MKNRPSIEVAAKSSGRRPRAGETLSARVIERLRADILSGRRAPGSKLRFEMLKSDYGVGLSPLREALSRLVSAGLVTVDGRRGFRVAAASLADIADIAMVREEIEGSALRKSIAGGDDAWEAQVVAARHRLALLERGQSKDVDNEDVWETCHRDFHLALIGACGSPWLINLAALVNDQFDRYRRLAILKSLSGRPTSLEHQQLMEASLDRDAERAVALLLQHIREALQLIVTSGAEFTGRAAPSERRLEAV